MPFTLVFLEPFQKALKKLDGSVKSKLPALLEKISENPLVGRPLRHYANYFRIRFGNYRLIYLVDEERNEVLVSLVGKRDNICEEFSRRFK